MGNSLTIFADRRPAVHAQGKGHIRKEIATTTINRTWWGACCASQFLMDFAEKSCLDSIPIPLPVNTDEIEFALVMDEEYNITLY